MSPFVCELDGREISTSVSEVRTPPPPTRPSRCKRVDLPLVGVHRAHNKKTKQAPIKNKDRWKLKKEKKADMKKNKGSSPPTPWSLRTGVAGFCFTHESTWPCEVTSAEVGGAIAHP